MKLPVHPRLARLLLEGARAGAAHKAALIAALLAEREPFRREERRRSARHQSPSDLLDQADAIEQFARSGRTDSDAGTIAPGAARFVLDSARQLERLVRETDSGKTSDLPVTESLLRAILAAFPDRLARRREPGSRKALMVGGRGVILSDSSAVRDSELFVCVDLDSSSGEAVVRRASAVERSWLPAEHLTTRIDVEFEPTTERLQARRRVYWLDLILEETPTALPEGDATAQALAAAALKNWVRVFPADDPALTQFLARIHCLREWMPDAELPAWTEPELQSLLPELAYGCRSFAELHRPAGWTSCNPASPVRNDSNWIAKPRND